jgi:hypothetical protein
MTGPGAGPLFSVDSLNRCMETLRKQSVKINGADGPEDYLLEEKDHGDLVVFDVSRKGQYLMTLAKDGSILFLNFDAPEIDRRVFKLSYLNQFVEKM